MNVDLAKLVINAPLQPTRTWNLNDRDWEEYRIYGFIGNIYVGRITITRGLNLARRESDRFFLDLTQEPPIPKPYVSYQETEESLRGQGIGGRMLILANEFYRGKLGTTIYSDTIFVHSFRTKSKRVWEKLQAEGFAEYVPHKTDIGTQLDRWRVL